MEERRQRREEMICVRVAHSLILRLTPIFILNLPSADYLISDIEHLNYQGTGSFAKAFVQLQRLFCGFWADCVKFPAGLFTWPGFFP